MSLRLLVILLAAILVAGQGSTVVCNSSWGWANNTLKQNPCVVASYLVTVCFGNTTVDPLQGPSNSYDPPPPGQRTPCDCSTVTYSLLTACELCQDSTTIYTWSDWSLNCPQISDRQYNESIPNATVVPGWAYLDVMPKNGFDPDAAKAFATSPQSTATSPITTGSSTSPTPSPSGSSGTSVRLDVPRVVWSCSVVFVYAGVLLGFL